MKLTKKVLDLISYIEWTIGYSCVNKRSFYDELDEFRYPVTVFDSEMQKEYKERCMLNNRYSIKLTSENIDSVRYVFGSNELFVGKGIVSALEYMEDRYGIDFAKLESEYGKLEREAKKRARERVESEIIQNGLQLSRYDKEYKISRVYDEILAQMKKDRHKMKNK